MARIPMSEKEAMEVQRLNIPWDLKGMMIAGSELTESEKQLVRSSGKVYVEAHKRNDVWVRPQLRDLPKSKIIDTRTASSKELVDSWNELKMKANNPRLSEFERRTTRSMMDKIEDTGWVRIGYSGIAFPRTKEQKARAKTIRD